MKQHRSFKQIVFVLLVAMFVLACAALTGGGTSAPEPVVTNPPETIEPVAGPPTATEPPNVAPGPTDTDVPISPTPAAVGEAVRSASYEVTVLQARELSRVYMGDYYYYPKAGQLFVELIVKVSNLTGSKASVPWKNVYVVEDTGDAWYSNWSGYKAVSTGKKVDGASIGVNETVDANVTIDFEDDVYLRMIWFLSKKDKTTILFGFDDSPNVEITIK